MSDAPQHGPAPSPGKRLGAVLASLALFGLGLLAPSAGALTLAFSAPDLLTGEAGCNRYTASFALSGEGLAFGRAAATRMACPGALMEQESGMLEALSEVARFDLDASGALLLYGGDEVLIRARRD